MRHNLAQELTGDLYGVSQATVSRICRYLLPILGLVTMMDRTHLADALVCGVVLVDGTPIPTGNRASTGKENFNGKHRKQALNVQVAAWPDGTLADVSAPMPGRRHDSAALRMMGWADQITHARHQNPDLAVVADSAYGAHTDWAARPKPAGKPRPAEDIRFNRAIASFRAPVERTIALLKQWRILSTGYRGRLDELPMVIHVIVNLEFYRLACRITLSAARRATRTTEGPPAIAVANAVGSLPCLCSSLGARSAPQRKDLGGLARYAPLSLQRTSRYQFINQPSVGHE